MGERKRWKETEEEKRRGGGRGYSAPYLAAT